MRKAVAVLLLCLMFSLEAFFLPGCRTTGETSGTEIYVPVLADATWLLADGAFLNGVNLALDELNTAYAGRGLVIKTAVIDDKALYETGVEKATELARDKAVTAVLNLQNFDVSKTTADILAASGKPVLFPYGAYDSLFEKDNPYLFCGVPAFSDLGEAVAAYVRKNGYKRLAVYYNGKQSQDEFVTAIELALLNSETKIVDYVSSIASGSEFDGIYSRWQALDADCVVIAQYGLERAFEVLKMLRTRDKEIAVIGEPIFNRASALAENKAIAEGMVVPSTLVIEESEELTAFKERYREKYGLEADIWAVQGYDMLRLVADNGAALETNNPAELASALHDEKGYRGIGRLITFKKGGAMVVDISRLPMLTCRAGRFE